MSPGHVSGTHPILLTIREAGSMLRTCWQSNRLKLWPRRLSFPSGDQSEPISVVAGKHVETSVGDLLEGGFAVGVEETDTVATEIALP